MRLIREGFFCAAFKRPPFRIEEEGWGEFDMEIVLTAAEKGGEHSLPHDLNFQSERYEAKHNVVSAHIESFLGGGKRRGGLACEAHRLLIQSLLFKLLDLQEPEARTFNYT